METATCKICSGNSEWLFDTLVLHKYPAKYFQCARCAFIQTSEPTWLMEAYTSPIGLIDVGLLQRNIFLSKETTAIFEQVFSPGGCYIDYGGGYGTFVRLMRDQGFDFYLAEKYTENLFAKYFELQHAPIESGFTCLTAFEVFEHLADPLAEIADMFKLSPVIFFSTELQPREPIEKAEDWWYFVPESGQHIALYSRRSLDVISRHFECHLYSDNSNLHILSKQALKTDPFQKKQTSSSFFDKVTSKLLGRNTVRKEPARESLLMKDFEFYKNKTTDGQS